MAGSDAAATSVAEALRPWHRLAVRLAAVFVAVTLLTVGVVGVLVHQRQSHEIEDTVGTQLLNIARVSGLLVDPALHADAAARRRADAPGYRRIADTLHTVQTETLLTTPMRTLIFELRPSSLESDGLVQALRTHATAVQRRTGLVIVVDAEPIERMPLPAEEALYRIGQEALHNVVKHANAANATL